MFPSGGDRVRPTDTPPAFYEADSHSQSHQYEKPRGMAMSRSDTERDVEAIAQEEYSSISISQKMISATWGSILTSILVTPLDVVRIRLQSQTPVIRVPMPPLNTFKQLPPNLGVSACCREVFWIGDNAQFCMVGQTHGGPNSTLNPSPSPSPSIAGSHSHGGSGGGAAAAECAVEETQRKSFTSTLDGLRKIARNEGAQSLWRGLSPTLIMAIPANVIYFTGYDWLRYDPRSPIARYVEPNSVAFVAGSVARVAAASVISPIEMFRTRLQATSGRGTDHFKATLRGLHQMTQTQGYSSLWRGLTLTMWRDVPFSGLYWVGYEAIKDSFAEMRSRPGGSSGSSGVTGGDTAAAQESNATVFVESFAAGALSGAAAAFITTPFDVGKTRQQVFHHAGDGGGAGASNTFSSSSFSFLKKKITASSSTNNTTTTTTTPSTKPGKVSIPRFLLQIFRDEGTAGLFRGWAARCLKVAPACAIMISSYEIGKKMAGQANERRESDV